jgi:hypothetical protein
MITEGPEPKKLGTSYSITPERMGGKDKEWELKYKSMP